MRLCSCFILLCFSFALHASNLSVVPPKGWDSISDPEQLPEKVCMIYIGTGKGQFSPSINLAYEETTLYPDEYMALAKSYHEGQGDTRCKQLGTIDTKAGKANLLQIDRNTQWGNVRFIQAVVLREKTAYVITATCLQEDFAALSAQLFKSIQTFSVNTQ